MAHSPLLVGVLDLLRHQGARRQLDVVVHLDGLELSTAHVSADDDVAVSLVLEAQGAQVIVQGTVSADWVGECRRCLGDAFGSLSAAVHEVFERDPTDGDTWPIEADRVDLEPIVRESVMLALPLAPLCSSSCAGPDPERFPAHVASDSAGLSDQEAPPTVDPRWAALDELRFDAE